MERKKKTWRGGMKMSEEDIAELEREKLKGKPVPGQKKPKTLLERLAEEKGMTNVAPVWGKLKMSLYLVFFILVSLSFIYRLHFGVFFFMFSASYISLCTMRYCRSDWPGLCLFYCYQPSCASQMFSPGWLYLRGGCVFLSFPPPPRSAMTLSPTMSRWKKLMLRPGSLTPPWPGCSDACRLWLGSARISRLGGSENCPFMKHGGCGILYTPCFSPTLITPTRCSCLLVSEYSWLVPSRQYSSSEFPAPVLLANRGGLYIFYI